MLDQLEEKINELKVLMREAPTLIDKKLLQAGENTVGVYFDKNYGSGIENYKSLKIKMIQTALTDLSSGGFLLKTRKIGLIFRDNRLLEYNAPYNENNPNGQLVASISLKSMRAFDGFRTKTYDEQILTDEQKNAAIYYLIYLLTKSE
ncbi:MAG: hypothetical protein AABZ31_12870 [Bdellovibrionota bacterium]